MSSVLKYILFINIIIICGCDKFYQKNQILANQTKVNSDQDTIAKIVKNEIKNVFDTALYEKKLAFLSHDCPSEKWPVKTPLPLLGALLPFNRIVAFYGNFYTKRMGILGALPEEKMLEKLIDEVSLWEKADSTTPVIPAIHYLAITAQASPGKGGYYRYRMPANQIEKAIALSKKVNGIAFLDIQVGHSSVEKELNTLEKYLLLPQVHLGIDPEWSMKDGSTPGTRIGTMDATDINYAVDYLAKLVRQYKLPPKILIVHRFTKGMITNYKKIKTCEEVQIVINMDGFGYPAKKVSTYKSFISGQPVQFTGFKLFYKNDAKSHPFRLMSPEEILNLNPKPVYIQYQ